MKPSLIVIYMLIVLLPLVLLAGFGLRVARDEQRNNEQRLQALLLEQLATVETTIQDVVSQRERQLLEVTGTATPNPDLLREITRRNPFIRQMFCLDTDGSLLYPMPQSNLNTDELAFLDRAREVLADHNLVRQSQSEGPAAQQNTFSKSMIDNTASQSTLRSAHRIASPMPEDHGWYVWYWGRGAQLLFWRADPSRRIIGAELDRSRLLADIIGRLPDTNPLQERPMQGRIVLTETTGEKIYQWGKYRPGEKEAAFVEKTIAYPLNAWKLQFYMLSSQRIATGGFYFSFIAGLIAVGLAVIGLSIYFYRESSREMREAEQRVSFVNHVSHELKTPLTNIRLYAELLKRGIQEDDEQTQKHLEVIVSESQRLSRLIGNILNFGRRQRKQLVLRMRPAIADEVIRSVLDNFGPAHESAKVDVLFNARAHRPALFDPDALEQILGNLFSNVEKYAASGKYMRVESNQEEDMITITVADHGPGIPSRQSEMIFQPFYRVSNKLTDGVAGTGIGLAIARDLAQLHGGNLEVMPSDSGAFFRLCLRASLVKEDKLL